MVQLCLRRGPALFRLSVIRLCLNTILSNIRLMNMMLEFVNR
ncbi:hypothetical protein AtEden1_Chr5g0134011 [Arabidopsis thaliana]